MLFRSKLSRSGDAFIRPSPSGGTLGGVARRTREALLVCEAAGFDVVVIETVGVGQSEAAVADLVDVFVLLIAPGAGDELQGIKKGIVELAHVLAVNKADGDLAAAAGRARRDYAGAVHLLRPASPGWETAVLKCSALLGTGIAEVWETLRRCHRALDGSGQIAARRAGQARAWMWSEVNETLMARLDAHPRTRETVAALEVRVAAGETTPGAAAREIASVLFGD